MFRPIFLVILYILTNFIGNCSYVIIPQALADNELFQRHSVLQHIHQLVDHESLCLAHILLGQQHIQRSTVDIFHNRCIVASFQDDAHALAFRLDSCVLFIHQPNVSFTAEEDEREEGFLIRNFVGLAALRSNTLSCGNSESDGLCEVFRGESDEDGIGISVDNLGSKLCLHNSLCKTQGFATCGGSTRCDAEFSDRTDS